MHIILKTCLITIVVAFVLFLICVIVVALDNLLEYILGFLGHIFLILLIVYILRLVTRLLVFPGSFGLCQRIIEVNNSNAIAKMNEKRIKLISAFLRDLIDKTNEFNAEENDLYFMKQHIINIEYSYGEIEKNGKLTIQQEKLLRLYRDLKMALSLIQVRGSNLYAVLDEGVKENLGPEQIQQCRQTLELLKEIEEYQRSLNQENRCFIPALLNKPPYGTLEVLRYQLSVYYNTQRHQLKSYDSKMIDAMVFSPKNSAVPEKLVLFCQPNAAYYEYMMHSNRWLPYYLEHNIGVFTWNYRGYGESEGTPSTKSIFKDAELVYDYILMKFKIKVIIIQGQSLGGMVATHLANVRPCSALIVDRTFSSLTKMASQMHMSGLFNVLTSWNFNSHKSYIQARCFKILAYDFDDKMIPYVASLKSGVTREILNSSFESDLKVDFSIKTKLLYGVRKICTNQDEQKFKTWFRTLINDSDFLSLYNALQRVGSIFSQVGIENRNRSLDDSFEIPEESGVQLESMHSSHEVLIDYKLTEIHKSEILHLARDIYNIFNIIEAAGMTLNDCINFKSQEVLQDMLLSLMIWGTYLPLHKQPNIDRQTQAYLNGKKAVSLMRDLIRLNRQSTFLIIQNITTDLLNISNRLENFLNQSAVITNLFKNKSSNLIVNQNSFDEDMKAIQLEIIGHSPYEDLNAKIGRLVPLRSGHNGNWNNIECKVLDYYLTQARILEQ